MRKLRLFSARSIPAKFGLILLFSFLFLPLYTPAQDDFDDPPARVARLSFIRGSVSFEPAGTDDWIDATWNRPVTTGDALWSDRDSRAALHIGSASIVLSENTGFSFLNLTDNIAQLQLTVGTLRLRVKRLGDNENFEVDTPNLAFSILRPGIYKISVNESGDATVIEDRAGEGEVTGGGAAYTVHSGELDTFNGTDQLYASMDSIYDNGDEFDQWCEQRDHHEDNSVSVRYVSDDVIGYDDLDDNGGWRPVPEYGYIWFPHTTIIGWAPYHYGHWAYIPPWGYTWVDDAPWGFAPFHYGRWVYAGGAWGWVPCPPRPAYSQNVVYVTPVYAPALVAWIGLGGGGSIGWFALGPREVYVPAYPVSRNYVTNVNVSNTTVNTTVINNYYNTVIVNKTVNVTNVTYVNQRVQGAVVATTPRAFSSGQPVAKNLVALNPSQVVSAAVVATTPPAVPEREAVLGGRPASTVKPPAAVQSRAVVAKTPPPPRPPSFTQRQAAIQVNGGRPLSAAQVRQIVPARTQSAATSQVKVAPPAKPSQIHNAQSKISGEDKANRPPIPATPPNGSNRSVPSPANASPPHPPTVHPQNEPLEQQHQQQIADLQKKQDEERQQLERQQQQERQKQQADEVKQKQLAQQQQQQLEQLQQKHQQEQQQLQQKQELEHREAEKQEPGKPQPKPKTDRPPTNQQ